MPVIDDIREQQKKAMKEKDLKGRLAYFWYYYKVHVFVTIAVIALAVSFIYQYVTNKEYGFYATFINASVADYEIGRTWADEFMEYAQIDPEEYEVYMDTSVQTGGQAMSQYAMSSQEKMFAMLQVGEINLIAADTEVFESYSQNEFFCNLSEVLPADTLEKYKDYLYYTDAATFDQGDDDTFRTADETQDPRDKVIDHKDPSSMKQPVAVGICITAADKLVKSGYYSYLATDNAMFQGYPSEVVAGIPLTAKNPELTIRFLEYLGL